MQSERRVKALFLAGLFLVCMCGLMLQIMETRLLSVIAWYYLAFFAISMAMFGMTAGDHASGEELRDVDHEQRDDHVAGERRPVRAEVQAKLQ